MRIILSVLAEDDLTGLFDLIATDSGIDRADAILSRIDETLLNLSEWPGIGRVRTDLNGAPRAFTIWPWIVLYEPLAEGDGILVWRIVDGRRDLPEIIHPPRR